MYVFVKYLFDSVEELCWSSPSRFYLVTSEKMSTPRGFRSDLNDNKSEWPAPAASPFPAHKVSTAAAKAEIYVDTSKLTTTDGEFFIHITPKRNLSSILLSGLEARVATDRKIRGVWATKRCMDEKSDNVINRVRQFILRRSRDGRCYCKVLSQPQTEVTSMCNSNNFRQQNHVAPRRLTQGMVLLS